jgi:hypothetical protein
MTVAELESRVTSLEAEVARLKEKLEYAEACAGIQRGLDEANRGLGKPAREVLERLRIKHNIPAK